MDFQQVFQQYWPFIALSAWLGYKWWSSKRVVAMLPSLRAKGATLIDVRSNQEFAQSHAPGCINIPLQQLNGRLAEISKTKPIVVCCASGSRSGMAKMLLKRNGFSQVYNVGSWIKLLD
jgi:phage shock protein E